MKVIFKEHTAVSLNFVLNEMDSDKAKWIQKIHIVDPIKWANVVNLSMINLLFF